jgi:hypothetical protein
MQQFQEANRIADIKDQKLERLLQHYQIDRSNKNAWYKLAVALACDHVPGFEVIDKQRKGRGRPAKWKDEDLVVQVCEIERERNRGIADAIRILQKRHREWKAYEPKALETRFHKAVRKIANSPGIVGTGDLDVFSSRRKR